MHFDDPAKAKLPTADGPWYREMNRYHWFVLIVAAVGWLADCMDQQLFNLARGPAMMELHPSSTDVQFYGGLATMIFMIGWATGGIIFGVLGDRWGRAKTMVLTIVVYSVFTGLSALSVTFWDFALWRFLTGLGVGGEFAVGVALVAEVMPESARSHALGWLQALSAVGNVSAAFVAMALAPMEAAGMLGEKWQPWRWMFVVGALPALLALVIRRKLKEPERWVALRQSGTEKLGSFNELFGDPRWRWNAIVGLILATSGVVGLWGIGFFGFDLVRSVFRQTFVQEGLDAGAAADDWKFVKYAVEHPDKLDELRKAVRGPGDLFDPDAATAYGILLEMKNAGAPIVRSSFEAHLVLPSVRGRVVERLDKTEAPARPGEVVSAIATRTKELAGRLTLWAGIYGLLFNIGAFFGIHAFRLITPHIGRKPTFAIMFVMALITTANAFWFLSRFSDVYWMVPLMGFFQISLFGGYAIYFPELFPTRLRSTGTSFCYNVGRYLASPGPLLLGALASMVFGHHGEVMSWRYAGVAMCSFFVIGLLVLPFAVETKGKPLPE